MKRWIVASLAFVMAVLMVPNIPVMAADGDAGYTLIYDYPEELCTFTVYDWYHAQQTPMGENASVYSQIVSVNSTGSSEGEGGEPSDLHKLTAPSDLDWGTYYYEGENGEMQDDQISGMISWTVTDTGYDQECLLKVYHESDPEEPVFESGWYYRAGNAEKCTDYAFSNRFPSEELPDGNYYFTLQALGDGKTTSDSDVVTSGIWNYANPNVSYEAPSYPEWAFPRASWYDWEYTYDAYCNGYFVEYWYSATEEDATTTDGLIYLGGHVQYFNGGRKDTSHVIPKKYVDKKGGGYYYYSVQSLSKDILTVSHSEKALSEACYLAEGLETKVTDDGLLTIVDQVAAEGDGWNWDGETLALEETENFAVKAVRFLPYVPEAEIVLKNDVTLDATDVKSAAYEYRPAISLEAAEGILEIRTEGNTLIILSNDYGIYSAGSMVIADSVIDANAKYEVIFADCGDMRIDNSNVKAVGGKWSWGIYVHGYREGEEDTCVMGNLTIEDSTVYASSVDETGEGHGNAIYSDGDMHITRCDITTNGGNNGIGNDCGGVYITDSTVYSVGDYLGIFSYHMIAIENSTVTAEGERAIEIASRTEEAPKEENIVLKKCKVSEPKDTRIAVAVVPQPWGDNEAVVGVVYDADASEKEDWVPAMAVKIIPAEEAPTLNEQIADLIPVEDEKIDVTQVQETLAERTEEIKQALNAEMTEEVGEITELVKQLEAATGIETGVNAEGNEQFTGASVLGAALNAAADSQKVELVINQPSASLSMPEDYENMDCVAFSMIMEGAVDADTAEGQQLVVPVQIRLPIPAGFDPQLTVVLHFLNNGTVEVITPQVTEGYITFVTDGFSDYALTNMASAEATEQGVVVKLAETAGKMAVAAAYNGNGQMLGTSCLINGTGEISCKTAEVTKVRFFLLDSQYAPVSESKTITLKN